MPRPRADRTIENALRRLGFARIAGVDEVGRGCLAGPVVAGAVVLDPDRHIPGLRDSKLLVAGRSASACTTRSPATRSAGPSPPSSPPKSTGSTSARPRSSAMRRAVLALVPLPDFVLVDAFRDSRTCRWPSAASSTATPGARPSPPPRSWPRSRATGLMARSTTRTRATASTGTRATRRRNTPLALSRFGYSPVHRRSFRVPSLFDAMDEAAGTGGRARLRPIAHCESVALYPACQHQLRARWLSIATQRCERPRNSCARGGSTRPSPNTTGSSRNSPEDWSTVNAVGDLLVRAGQLESGIEHFTRIADHFFDEGFLPRAAAVYKKILKLTPDDDHAALRTAEIAEQQGLLADAKAALSHVAARRLKRGDKSGAAEIHLKLGLLDPTDLASAVSAAKAAAELGNLRGAIDRLLQIAGDYARREQADEAIRVARRGDRARAGATAGVRVELLPPAASKRATSSARSNSRPRPRSSRRSPPPTTPGAGATRRCRSCSGRSTRTPRTSRPGVSSCEATSEGTRLERARALLDADRHRPRAADGAGGDRAPDWAPAGRPRRRGPSPRGGARPARRSDAARPAPLRDRHRGRFRVRRRGDRRGHRRARVPGRRAGRCTTSSPWCRATSRR